MTDEPKREPWEWWLVVGTDDECLDPPWGTPGMAKASIANKNRRCPEYAPHRVVHVREIPDD